MSDFQKTGPHCIKASRDALHWARQAPIVKAVNDTTPLRVARPDAIRIYRRYFSSQLITRAGEEVVVDVLLALGDATCDFIELYNETAQHGYEGLDRYITFHAEAVAYLESIRHTLPTQQQYIQILGYSFSTGCPEQADWELLRRRRYGGVRAIGMHCYWGRRGFTPWHALRYRQAHEWTEGDHPPFIITECGIDRIEDGYPGWKLVPNMTGQQYLDQLKGYDAELCKDAYVIGATPFTAGPTSDWNSFETDGLVGMMRLTPLAPALSIPTYEPTALEEEEPVTYTFELGFAEYAAEHPEVGEPAGPLQYDTHGNAMQDTTEGILFWEKATNTVKFYSGEWPIPPEPAPLVRAMDVSSHQPTDLTALIQAHRIEHVIVRLYQPDEQPSQDITREQIASTRANGCTVGGYMWLYAAWEPRQAPAGLPSQALFKPCRLVFSMELTLPAAPAQIDPHLSWTPAEIQKYEAFYASYPSARDRASIHNRMLGYPEQLQDDMQLESALAAHGLHSLTEPGAAQAAARKDDWVLLLQVDSDPNPGMRWGSAGMLYYWIQKSDLAARRFGNTWLVLQSD